ncbi:MAG: 2-oxo acid dehydrogenase subunit E2 [Treponema sp.]|jgi:pyruvate dehydrogenase E2 component (dihydrolipoamide acetyltransferase)|nr:2-oxo acid dehydrogenase subunit E2 [Treponema sp.]HPK79422.1 dihydrolipoamide acetyltransferase family protein [Rectinema sp.]HQJ22312.1 dihydrolipoamide acetyltransferase family protein [Rectinema sp.]
MAEKIIMPKLGNTVESSVILSWKVKPGDTVTKDTILCEIETDKATMEVPAGVDGTVLALLKREGDDVPVLEPIAIVGAPEEVWENAADSSQANTASIPISASTSTVFEQEKEATMLQEANGKEPHSSPRARMAMHNLGVDLGAIDKGSGPGGRILEKDVIEASIDEKSNQEVSMQEPPIQGAFGKILQATQTQTIKEEPPTHEKTEFQSIPLIGIRKRIAGRMHDSVQTTAQYTEHSSADAEHLVALRARLKAQENPNIAHITIGDLVLTAVIKILPEFPEFNAHLEGNELRLFKPIHLGVAVDTPRGLMVPVIRNAQDLSLLGVSMEVKRLAKACQSGRADPASLSGSTFTVTNLGAFGVEWFTPIVNTPETAILGVCTIRPTPVKTDKGIENRMRIGLSLTVDHQVIDGAYAARFLRRLSEIIADIDIMPFSL